MQLSLSSTFFFGLKNWGQTELFLSYPVGFQIPIILHNFNYNCSNVLELRIPPGISSAWNKLQKHSVSKIGLSYRRSEQFLKQNTIVHFFEEDGTKLRIPSVIKLPFKGRWEKASDWDPSDFCTKNGL